MLKIYDIDEYYYATHTYELILWRRSLRDTVTVIL